MSLQDNGYPEIRRCHMKQVLDAPHALSHYFVFTLYKHWCLDVKLKIYLWWMLIFCVTQYWWMLIVTSLLDFLSWHGTVTEFEPEILMTSCCVLKPSNLHQWRESLWYLLVQWSINNETPQNLTNLPRSPLPTMRPPKEPCSLWSMDAFPSPLKTMRPPQPLPHCSQWAAIHLPLVVLTPELLITHGACLQTMCMMYPRAHGRRGSLSFQPNPCHWLESVAHQSLTIYQLILEIYLIVPPQTLPLPLKPQPLRPLMARMDDSSDLSSDDEYPSNCLFDDAWDKSCASSNWQTYKCPQDNPLLDSLVDDINGIIFSLEEDEDIIHLRQSLLNSMSNASDSIQVFQHVIIRMLSTLLNENLFIPSAPSMIALHELQATQLTHTYIGNSIRYVASGEYSNYLLNTTHFPSSKSPSDPIADPSGPMQQPPHVSGTVADDPGVGTSTPSHVTNHVTQKTRKHSRWQHWWASAKTKKETQSESLSPLHGADTIEKHIARPQ